MTENVKEAIRLNKLITIVRGVEAEKLLPLARAMYDGGIRLIEVTYDASKKVTDEATAEMIRSLARAYEGRMFIGAGSVLSEKQVELTRNAGGSFIISPDTNEAVIRRTKELGLVSIPGALTPTEIQRAHLAGADFVKLFPVTSLGPQYIKAVRAPLCHIEFLAVGGVNEDNLRDYLAAGVSGFGLGTNIVDKKLLQANDYAGITRLAEKYVAAVKE